MRRFLARFSEPVRSVHAPSWADFITATPEFKLSVHTTQLLQAKNASTDAYSTALSAVASLALSTGVLGVNPP
jgi:hypothetical protein